MLSRICCFSVSRSKLFAGMFLAVNLSGKGAEEGSPSMGEVRRVSPCLLDSTDQPAGGSTSAQPIRMEPSGGAGWAAQAAETKRAMMLSCFISALKR